MNQAKHPRGFSCGAIIQQSAPAFVLMFRFLSSRAKRTSTMRNYLEVAVEAAKIGGDVLKQYYQQDKGIEHKGEIDIVTEADKRSEKLIVELLNVRFPKHSILAEEGTDISQPSEFRWVIDPLDGTTNFAHDYPF